MTDEQEAPKNREQRRAERHRKAVDAPQDNLRPQSSNNPTFGRSDLKSDPSFGTPSAAHTGQPDQDQTSLTGPGTGGATESGDRVVHHEATPPAPNRPNS